MRSFTPYADDFAHALRLQGEGTLRGLRSRGAGLDDALGVLA
jgi:hypothetical protein